MARWWSVLLALAVIFPALEGINLELCPPLPFPSHCDPSQQDYCSSDTDCEGSFRCCYNGCIKICASAITKIDGSAIVLPTIDVSYLERAGKCPRLPIPKYCQAVGDRDASRCITDQQCKAPFKCCSNGCIKRCYLANQIKKAKGGPSQRPAISVECPIFKRNSNCVSGFTNRCRDDDDCRNEGVSMKCCFDGCRRLCLDPSEILLGKGDSTCPSLRRPSSCTNSQNDCLSDEECGENRKCCSDGCQLKCVLTKSSTPEPTTAFTSEPSTAPTAGPSTPEPSIPTTDASKRTVIEDKCPFVAKPPRCPFGYYHQCFRSEECPKNLLCCSDGCRNICLDPEARSLLQCPVLPRPLRCLASMVADCLSDVDCGAGNKCCYDGCRYKCYGKDLPIKGKNEGSLEIPSLLSKAEVVFVLDTSKSDRLNAKNFEGQKNFVKSMAQYLNLGPNYVRTAIVTYDETVRVVKNLTTIGGFEKYLDTIRQGGRRKLLHLAIKAVEQKVLPDSRPDVPMIVVIVSYGPPSSTEWTLLIARRGLRVMGADVFVVGIGVHPAYTRLRRLVITPGDLFTFPSASFLQTHGSTIASHISVRTADIVPSDFKADFMFLVDASQAVGRQGLTKLKLFVLSLARLLNLAPGLSRASVIPFGDVIAPISIRFIRGSDMSIFSDSMNRLSFLGGNSRLDSIFETTKENIDNTRDGVRKIAVMITTGKHLKVGMDSLDQQIKGLRDAGLWTNVVLLGENSPGRADLQRVIERPSDLFQTTLNDLTRLIPRLVKHIVSGPAVAATLPPTTAIPTTEAPTTQPIITAKLPPTTKLETTILPTTAESTTKQTEPITIPTTAEPTTTQPTTTQPTTTEQTTTAPTTAAPTTTPPTTTPPTTTPPTTTQPTTTPPTTTPPTTTPPTTTPPTTTPPTTTAPTTAKPEVRTVPTTAEPTTRRVTTQPVTVAAGHVLRATTGPAASNKPGYCPTLPRPFVCLRNPQCHIDSQCIGNQKCCSDGCSRVCVNPNLNVENAPAREKRKPGICPAVPTVGDWCPSVNQCAKDADCIGNKKCCKQTVKCAVARSVCVEPPSREEERKMMSRYYRPGQCPVLPKPSACGEVKRAECNYDVDCSGSKKCCTNGCRRVCADAVDAKTTHAPPTNPGKRPEPEFSSDRCPPYSPVRVCPALVQDECTCDVDCTFRPGYKCCFDGCKRICRRPAGSLCSGKIDVVYLMDTSGSISRDDYRREKQFVKDLARIFNVGDDASHASVIIYNDDAHVMVRLGQHKTTESFAKAVDAIPYLHGRTRIDRALQAAEKMFVGARKAVNKVLIVLTDGRQTPDPDAVALDRASQPMKDNGVKIYAVGVGSQIDIKELNQIAANSSDVFTVDSFSALLGESQTIARKACDYISEKICVQGVDLGFIVDSSESITDHDFLSEKNAVKAISEQFLITPSNTRVGVVVYSDNPYLSIGLGRYQTNADFNSAVSRLNHMQSHTRLDKALRFAASNLFNNRRPGYPAIAIIMTDGRQTPGAESLSTAVQPLRDLGVHVFAVGVGSRVSLAELNELVLRSEDIYQVASFDNLIVEAKKVSRQACPAPIQPSPTPRPTVRPTRATERPTRRTTRATERPITTPTTTLSTTAAASLSTREPDKCTHFLDIIFVVDSSGSMDIRQYAKMKEFVKRLAVFLDVGKGSKASVIIYSDDPVLAITFDQFQDQAGFSKGVDELIYIMQRTRIDKALLMASDVLKDSRPGFPKAVIVMTDGRQTRDPDMVPLKQAAKPLHDEQARVLVIGIGDGINVQELVMMVGDPADVFTVDSFDSLLNAASNVAVKSCTDPVFPTRNNGPCGETFDLGFILDSSGSMLIPNHNKEKEFITNMAANFLIGPRRVMLGLIAFSDTASTLVRFASPASVSLVPFEQAVDKAPYMRGRTRLDRALEEAKLLFQGGRPSVPKVLVLLSDGRQSKDPGYTPLAKAIRPLLDQKVAIRVVGIGTEIDEAELQTMASNRNEDIYRVGSFDDLRKLHRSLSESICRTVGRANQARDNN